MDKELTIRKYINDLLNNNINIDHKTNLQLGELYALLGDFEEAYSHFTIAANSDVVEQRWVAYVKKAMVMKYLNFSINNIINLLMDAYNLRPNFIDPLIVASQICRENNKIHQALLYITMAISIPMPNETTDPDVYIWKVVYEYMLCSKYAGYYENALNAIEELLEVKNKIPDDIILIILHEKNNILNMQDK